MGDERTYENVVALRIVESVDAMTADWARVPYDVLRTISNRIINEVSDAIASCWTSVRSRREQSSGNSRKIIHS